MYFRLSAMFGDLIAASEVSTRTGHIHLEGV